MAHGRLRIEMAAHRLDAFLPGVVVQDEIAEAWMSLKMQAEQILGFAFVPVCCVNKLDDARKGFFGERRSDQHMHPTGVAFAVKGVTQLPFACAFLDNQAGETEIPFKKKPSAKLRQHGVGAGHFARRTGVEPALRLAGPALFNLFF